MRIRWPWSRKFKPTPWEGLRAFDFSGVYYARNDEEDKEITDAIAWIVCANGGTVIVRPAPDEDAGDTTACDQR